MFKFRAKILRFDILQTFFYLITQNDSSNVPPGVTKPMIGPMMSATIEAMTAENAAPMITPTAKSTTFPRIINALKSPKNPVNLLTPALPADFIRPFAMFGASDKENFYKIATVSKIFEFYKTFSE